MNTLILCATNNNNSELTELHNLLLPNKKQYADRHGYDLQIVSVSYDKIGCMVFFGALQQSLIKYDRVMSVGVDIIFMNHRIKLNSFEDYPLTISRECIQWWPINNDVCIWMGEKGMRLAQRILDDIDIWIKYPWLWQIHLWNLIQDEPEIAAMVNIVEPRLLGSTPFKGASEWQIGNFLVHLLALPIPEKIKLAHQYLPKAGEPTWKP